MKRRRLLLVVSLALLAPLITVVGRGSGATAGWSRAGGAMSRRGPASARLLYGSDWSGPSQIYAADPLLGRVTAQVTFGRRSMCGVGTCSYGAAVPSPNGQLILDTARAACDSALPPNPLGPLASLIVARADGTHRRVLARTHSTCGYPRGFDSSWAPDSKRIAYAADGQVHITDISGRQRRVIGRGERVGWSPDGASIAFSARNSAGGYGPLSVRGGGRTRVVAAVASDFVWSPTGRWLAFTFTHAPAGPSELALVRSDGSARRTLLTGYLFSPQWSPDSRFLSVQTPNDIALVNTGSGASRRLASSLALAWRPHGHALTASGAGGTTLVDAATGATRVLAPDQAIAGSWSSDGRLLAYLTQPRRLGTYENSDLRVATFAGKTRTLVRADGTYGGQLSDLAWTRVPKGAHYRKPQPRVLAAFHTDGLTARWPIVRLAADGERVAYTSCGHVFVWTPSKQAVVQAEPNSSLGVRCTTPGNYLPFSQYTLALSGDRVAWGDVEGNAGQSWGLYAGRVASPASFISLGRVYSANACAVGDGGLGNLSGDDELLVFSTWRDSSLSAPCPVPTLEQSIHRVDASGCPCQVIASSPGPLVPFDVDQGRIVAGGENATVVYDATGKELLSVPVPPLAAQLSGRDLVILVQGQLLVYDAVTGTRLHAWPLPDVPSGGECGSPHSGAWECGEARLLLEDAGDGLVTYALDGEVHVLRLADGADSVIAAGTLARFMDAGLVYADGSQLRLVPFDQLPPR